MDRTTIHIASFRQDYNLPQQRDIFGSVIISIHSIYLAFVISTSKNLVGSFTNVLTFATRLRGIARTDNYHRHTIKQCFVFKFCSQIAKIPPAKFCSKLLISALRSKPDISKVFNRNTFALFLCRLNNRFTDRVILNSCRSFLFPGKPFQQLLSVACAFGLNGTTNPLSFFSVIIKPFSRMFFAVRSYCQICYAKIHSNKFLEVLHIFFRDFNGLAQKKLVVLINKIGFTLNVRQIISVMANKRYLLPSTQAPYRNNIIGLVIKYSTIIGNTAQRLKSAFLFPINLITVSNLRNTSYKHLTAKFERLFEGMVNFSMDFELIKYLAFPSHIRNSITTGVCLFEGIKKQISLFISRQKFYLQGEFHRANIQNNFLYLKHYLITKGERQFLPQMNQWVSLPKLS